MDEVIENLPIDKKLYNKLHSMVAVYSLENQIDLYELKATIDRFYERYLKALDKNE